MVKDQLSQIPAYRTNRERAAVVLKQGLDAYEIYVRARPWAFAASLVSAAVCGAALWHRRRAGREAQTLYTVGLIGSLAVAWFTRPPPETAAVKAAKPEEKAGAGIIAMIDAKRAAFTEKDPTWADQTMARVAGLPGVREQIDEAPVLRAVLG
jgi:hypothetical protein